MYYLDVVSLFRISRVCKRFFHLGQEEMLWTHVDMTTLPSIDLRKIRKFIDQKLSPKLHSISMQSSFQLKAKRPRIDNNVLNALVEKCPNIKKIELRNCDLSALSDGECKLIHSQSIESVSFTHCNTNVWWLSLANWPALRHLSLANTVKTSHSEIKAIVTKPWALNSLNFSGCYRINDDAIRILCTSESPMPIVKLYLSGTSITNVSLDVLAKLPLLKELYLANVNGLTDQGIQQIPSLLPSLKVLDVSKLTNVSMETFEQLKEDMPHTKILNN